jgi:hypothetical protein
VTILPGSYIGRDLRGGNPGADAVRISLVPGVAECIEAAQRIREYVKLNPMPSSPLASLIDAAFEQRAQFSPKNAPADIRTAVEEAIALLDSGKARVARSATASGRSTSG